MTALLLRPSWADDPAVVLPCQEPEAAPHPYRDIFHPAVSGEAATEAILYARRWCNRCPQRDACLEFGLSSNESGIWGGEKLDGMSARGKRDLLADVRKRRGAA